MPQQPKGGVKVSLPEGWSAQIAADHSFQAGPRGRPVLRIDLRPGAAELFPSEAQLQAALIEQLGAPLSFQSQKGPNAHVLRYRFEPDAGPATHALVGAKRVGEDLFLCASLPGASEQELTLAAEACLGLSSGPAPSAAKPRR